MKTVSSDMAPHPRQNERLIVKERLIRSTLIGLYFYTVRVVLHLFHRGTLTEHVRRAMKTS